MSLTTHRGSLPRSWNTDSASLDLKLSLSNGHSVGFWKIVVAILESRK